MYHFIRLFITLCGCFIPYSVYAETITPSSSTPTELPTRSQPSSVVAVSSKSLPIATKLDLTRDGNRLYAKILVQQSQDEQGKIVVEWTPPMHSICSNSHYVLAYKGKNYHTHCYRTLTHLIKGKTFTCNGDWKVVVKNLMGSTLAENSVSVSTQS